MLSDYYQVKLTFTGTRYNLDAKEEKSYYLTYSIHFMVQIPKVVSNII